MYLLFNCAQQVCYKYITNFKIVKSLALATGPQQRLKTFQNLLEMDAYHNLESTNVVANSCVKNTYIERQHLFLCGFSVLNYT